MTTTDTIIYVDREAVTTLTALGGVTRAKRQARDNGQATVITAAGDLRLYYRDNDGVVRQHTWPLALGRGGSARRHLRIAARATCGE